MLLSNSLFVCFFWNEPGMIGNDLISCSVSNHSRPGMRQEWFNMVLSLYNMIYYRPSSTHPFFQRSNAANLYQFITIEKQDHQHSVIQFSFDRTEPDNTFAWITTHAHISATFSDKTCHLIFNFLMAVIMNEVLWTGELICDSESSNFCLLLFQVSDFSKSSK